MLTDKTIHAKKRVKQFMSDTMVGLEKEDTRSSEAEVGSEVLQKATKTRYEGFLEAWVQVYCTVTKLQRARHIPRVEIVQ